MQEDEDLGILFLSYNRRVAFSFFPESQWLNRVPSGTNTYATWAENKIQQELPR